jgi:molecular chaperone Hsp33
MTPTDETGFDRTLVFTLPEQDAHGRIVRLGPVLDTILSAHAYPPVIERLLAEALVLTALMGSTLKAADGQVTIQAQTDNGAVTLLVCDYLAGQLRGHIGFDADKLAEIGPEPTLFGLFGKGFLAISVDDGAEGGAQRQRYQGIVPLDAATLADAAGDYFRHSVQLPTIVTLATRHDAGAGAIAAGVMIQQLASGELDGERLEVRAESVSTDERWNHVATIAETITAAELTDADLSLEAMVWRLYNEEERVLVSAGPLLTRGCRCEPAYLSAVLARFPEEDRIEMMDEHGKILIDCAFCSRQFAIDLSEPPVAN